MKTRRATVRHMELLDDIHASADLLVVKPKHEMRERVRHLHQGFAMIRDELMLDGDSRRKIQGSKTCDINNPKRQAASVALLL